MPKMINFLAILINVYCICLYSMCKCFCHLQMIHTHMLRLLTMFNITPDIHLRLWLLIRCSGLTTSANFIFSIKCNSPKSTKCMLSDMGGGARGRARWCAARDFGQLLNIRNQYSACMNFRISEWLEFFHAWSVRIPVWPISGSTRRKRGSGMGRVGSVALRGPPWDFFPSTLVVSAIYLRSLTCGRLGADHEHGTALQHLRKA